MPERADSHGGVYFDIRVDQQVKPRRTLLKCGVVTKRRRQRRRALFRFPVTVVVPEPPVAPVRHACPDTCSQRIASSLGETDGHEPFPGQITRQFLTVPRGAAWIDVAVTGGDTYGGGDNGNNPRLYALHLQQVSDDDAQ